MKTVSVALATLTIVLAIAGCMWSPKDRPPGEYTSTHTSTNAAGTETTKTTKTNVYYDQNGNKRATEETDSSRDPEGLMNKTTSKSTKTY